MPCVRPLPSAWATFVRFAVRRGDQCAHRSSALEDAFRVVRPGGSHRTPPSGLSKDRPSIDISFGVHSRTPRGALRPDAATRPTCSAFVVSHHPDGLLHRNLRRLVASCSRPWGSSGFVPRPRSRKVRELPTDAAPFRAFPSRAAAPCVTAGPCPLAVIGCDTDPTSRPCSTRESVASLTVSSQLRPLLSWASPTWSLASVSLAGDMTVALPARCAPAASLLARLGRHLAGVSSRGPRALRQGLRTSMQTLRSFHLLRRSRVRLRGRCVRPCPPAHRTEVRCPSDRSRPAGQTAPPSAACAERSSVPPRQVWCVDHLRVAPA